jgi:hypothetical protein
MSAEKYAVNPIPDSEGNVLDTAPEERRQVLDEWLNEPETKRRLKACVDAAIDRLTDEPALRVPRSLEERENRFDRWLSSWKARLGPVIQEQFGRQFPEIHRKLPPEYMTQVVSTWVWPEIERFLLSYAIWGLSRSWVSRHLGDAVILCEPERTNTGWNVPIQLRQPKGTVPIQLHRPEGNVGVVVLDRDGAIDEEQTTSREALLTLVHD